jgi:hypothetical protein
MASWPLQELMITRVTGGEAEWRADEYQEGVDVEHQRSEAKTFVAFSCDAKYS